ncbi:hypothetical protein BDZ45DRAFT_139607 [Acephala macrosclerotiorum]|nr:hypothetical protein BDZ45DRAFT_139607 [Acephala macrosclerotiorum]
MQPGATKLFSSRVSTPHLGSQLPWSYQALGLSIEHVDHQEREQALKWRCPILIAPCTSSVPAASIRIPESSLCTQRCNTSSAKSSGSDSPSPAEERRLCCLHTSVSSNRQPESFSPTSCIPHDRVASCSETICHYMTGTPSMGSLDFTTCLSRLPSCSVCQTRRTSCFSLHELDLVMFLLLLNCGWISAKPRTVKMVVWDALNHVNWRGTFSGLGVYD